MAAMGFLKATQLHVFYWIVFVYSHHVEFIINTPMYIDDAFRIVQEHGTSTYAVRETHSIMFEDLNNFSF